MNSINFLKKILKISGILILLILISIPLGIFFFEYTPWKNVSEHETHASITFQVFIIISILYYTFSTKKFGPLKVLIGLILFTGILVFLVNIGIPTDGMEEYKWIIITVFLPVVYFMMYGMTTREKNKKCAWCGSFKINFKSGKDISWSWQFRNKDGSQDKRVKDNVKKASYSSKFECMECNALTKFEHYIDKKPNNNVKIWKRELLVKGKGERTEKNWEGNSAKSIILSGENRKKI